MADWLSEESDRINEDTPHTEYRHLVTVARTSGHGPRSAPLSAAPTEPNASGEIPNSQFSGVSASMLVPAMKNQPL